MTNIITEKLNQLLEADKEKPKYSIYNDKIKGQKNIKEEDLKEGLFSQRKIKKIYIDSYNKFSDNINRSLKDCELKYGGAENTTKEQNHHCYFNAVVSSTPEFVKDLERGKMSVCKKDNVCISAVDGIISSTRQSVEAAIEKVKYLHNKI